MSDSSLPKEIGRYKILSQLGKGGMGEVFLAYDPQTERKLALKRIKPELAKHLVIQRRFLQEAKIACSLCHPSIIPIHEIHEENDIYYTMPYIEGITLKEILKSASTTKHEAATSVAALMRPFISICQAIAHVHSRNILHRDLKPENAIIGQYGEVVLIDWGLAKRLDDPIEEENISPDIVTPPSPNLTKPGRPIGTIAYLAPERAHAHPSNFSTDIFALGVLLYQILTLHMPFKRRNMEDFKEVAGKEEVEDPSLLAPYREIPPILSKIALKCLENNPQDRYASLHDLLEDLAIYQEGRSQWFEVEKLSLEDKEKWLFEENVLIPKHTVIDASSHLSSWVNMRLSKASFVGNVRLEGHVKFEPGSQGIGFLLNASEKDGHMPLVEGSLLWIGTKASASYTRLVRSGLEVVSAPHIALEAGKDYFLRIEKTEQTISLYINHELQFSHISHLPQLGSHIAFLLRDDRFNLSEVTVFVGNLSLNVSCLAVADALLANKNYESAFREYQKISTSFPGTRESIEALFRSGITLLEASKESNHVLFKPSESSLQQILDQFEKLRTTSGAPLEYLGKALVYESMNETEEELKCLELALRRYPKHPLLEVIYEHIFARMYATSQSNRQATYRFLWMALDLIEEVNTIPGMQKLLSSLINNWEELPFLPSLRNTKEFKKSYIKIALAFWLAKPVMLITKISSFLHAERNELETVPFAINALCHLDASAFIKEAIHLLKEPLKTAFSPLLQDDLASSLKVFFNIHPKPTPLSTELLQHLLKKVLLQKKFELFEVPAAYDKEMMPLLIEYCLWTKDWKKAQGYLHACSLEELSKENSIYKFLYGCYLAHAEGEKLALIHLTPSFEKPYPHTKALAAHYLTQTLSKQWQERSFPYERVCLYQDLSLFYHCLGNEKESQHFQTLAAREKDLLQ